MLSLDSLLELSSVTRHVRLEPERDDNKDVVMQMPVAFSASRPMTLLTVDQVCNHSSRNVVPPVNDYRSPTLHSVSMGTAFRCSAFAIFREVSK